MVATGCFKNKKKIVFWQGVQIFLSIITNIMLGSFSGALNNFVGFIRNVLCYKEKFTNSLKAILMIIIIVLTLFFNNNGWIGWLPVLSSCVYTINMNEKNIIKFKCIIIFTMFCWCVHDFYMMAYTSAIFNVANIIMNIFSIVSIKKEEKKS